MLNNGFPGSRFGMGIFRMIRKAIDFIYEAIEWGFLSAMAGFFALFTCGLTFYGIWQFGRLVLWLFE